MPRYVMEFGSPEEMSAFIAGAGSSGVSTPMPVLLVNGRPQSILVAAEVKSMEGKPTFVLTIGGRPDPAVEQAANEVAVLPGASIPVAIPEG